jgi:hypothetical protein
MELVLGFPSTSLDPLVRKSEGKTWSEKFGKLGAQLSQKVWKDFSGPVVDASPKNGRSTGPSVFSISKFIILKDISFRSRFEQKASVGQYMYPQPIQALGLGLGSRGVLQCIVSMNLGCLKIETRPRRSVFT